MRTLICFLLATSIGLIGCTGTPRYQDVMLKTSLPAGHYSISEGGQPVKSAGPGSISLDRALDHDLVITAQGYKPKTVHVVSEVQGGRVVIYVCQSILVPVIGLVMFFALAVPTHAWDDLMPNPVPVDLEPSQTGDR